MHSQLITASSKETMLSSRNSSYGIARSKTQNNKAVSSARPGMAPSWGAQPVRVSPQPVTCHLSWSGPAVLLGAATSGSHLCGRPNGRSVESPGKIDDCLVVTGTWILYDLIFPYVGKFIIPIDKVIYFSLKRPSR